MLVYVIETGQYSDRHVVGVTDNENKAKEICKAIEGGRLIFKNSTTYTPYDTDQFQIQKLRYTVDFNMDDSPVCEYDDYGFYDYYYENVMEYPGFFIIYADTPEQAIKIACDMRAEAEAERNGLC